MKPLDLDMRLLQCQCLKDKLAYSEEAVKKPQQELRQKEQLAPLRSWAASTGRGAPGGQPGQKGREAGNSSAGAGSAQIQVPGYNQEEFVQKAWKSLTRPLRVAPWRQETVKCPAGQWRVLSI
ncbi:uncharacterized protein PHA67_000741 isoform 1-T1 [Liasis olivaceus]